MKQPAGAFGGRLFSEPGREGMEYRVYFKPFRPRNREGESGGAAGG